MHRNVTRLIIFLAVLALILYVLWLHNKLFASGDVPMVYPTPTVYQVTPQAPSLQAPQTAGPSAQPQSTNSATIKPTVTITKSAKPATSAAEQTNP